MEALGQFLVMRVLIPLATFVYGRLFGWKLDRPFPELDRYIILAEPHTSNWDVPILLYASALTRRRFRYIIKKEAENWFILGRVFKWSGGIFIDRDKPLSAIKTIIRTVRENEQCILLISPKGTRAYRDGWKPGFYYLAQKLDLPLVCSAPDYPTKTVFVSDPIVPSGDIEADMAQMRPFYAPIRPRHPERTAPIRLLEEDASTTPTI
jgi:1-acyl-sn-glycerol-3-phosphate acyltransferase